jgi:methyl-accepting chemotaxis protein
MSNNIDAIYSDSTEPLVLLGRIETHVLAISADIFRSLQHNPASEASKIHAGHGIAEHLDVIDVRLNEINKLRRDLSAVHFDQKEKKLAAQIDEKYDLFMNDVIFPTIASLRANDFSLAMQERFLLGYRKVGAPLERTIEDLIDQLTEVAKENFEQATQAHHLSRAEMLIAFAVSVVLSTFIAWRIIRSIVTPLSILQKAMHEIEDSGDFTRRVNVSGSDEIGQTAATFNHLIGALQETLCEILDHTAQLDVAATDLAITAQQVAKSSEMTSESSSAMATAVEEMTVSVSQISLSARETSKLTQDTGNLSQQGSVVIHQTVGEMRAVAETVNKSSEVIAELSQQFKQVSSVLQMIEYLADQTNLLALNAAIEAAHAGDRGRGFAVVASEVKKLSERTTEATIEVEKMVAAIQKSSDSAVKAMDSAAKRVESGVMFANQAEKAIVSIQQGSEQVQVHIDDVTSVLAEQNATSQSIAQQIERVAQAAEENSAAARNASDAVKSVELLAHTVRGEVERFKVCGA